MWLTYAGEVEARHRGRDAREDELAFLRDGGAYRNLLLVEMPNGDFATTMARQLYFDHFHLLLLRALARSEDPRVAEIAAKSAKEVTYHVERSNDWTIRLGDGTAESHARMQAALDDLWPYTGEMFVPDTVELCAGRRRHRGRRPRVARSVARGGRGRLRRGHARAAAGRVDAEGRQAGRAHRASGPPAHARCNSCSGPIPERSGDGHGGATRACRRGRGGPAGPAVAGGRVGGARHRARSRDSGDLDRRARHRP